MKPSIDDYRIIYFSGKYFVATPYDLMSMQEMILTGPSHGSYTEAKMHLSDVFDTDLKTYERLKVLGRSFPDND